MLRRECGEDTKVLNFHGVLSESAALSCSASAVKYLTSFQDGRIERFGLSF
jgi:hypothetical protein